MGKKLIAAIDIGTTKIVAIIGRATKGNQIEVISMASVPSLGVERGVVKDIEEASDSITKALAKLNEKVQYRFTEVWVGIAGRHVKSFQQSSEVCFEESNHKVTYPDIESLLKSCIEKQKDTSAELVNIVPQSFELDDDIHTKSPLGMTSSRLKANFLLTVSETNACHNIKKALENNNLKSKKLVLESLASAKSVLLDSEVEKGVVLIDIGGGTSDLAIFYGGEVVHSSVIPFGGEAITSDLMQKPFSLKYHSAQKIKHENGSVYCVASSEEPYIIATNKEGKKVRIKHTDIVYAIKARVDEIIDLIDQQIDISDFGDKIEAGIVLTGGGSLLRDLKQAFKFRFKDYDIRIGSPRKHFFSGSFLQDLNTPTYATVTGLLLHGLESAEYERKITSQAKGGLIKEEEPLEEENRTTTKRFEYFRRNWGLNHIFKNNIQDDKFE